MIDYRAVRLALRAKLLTLSVCTTGSASIAATATGYTRSVGSFLTDGFAVGMEVSAAGFATSGNNGKAVVTALTATVMTATAYTITATATGYTYAARTLAVEAETSGRTISVGIPTLRAWENVAFEPTVGVPYVVEQFIPGPTTKITLGAGGEVEGLPMYAPHVHVPAGVGVGAADAYADALMNHLAPLTSIALSSGTLRVRGDTGPYRAQMLQTYPGFAVVPVTVPLRLRTANAT